MPVKGKWEDQVGCARTGVSFLRMVEKLQRLDGRELREPEWLGYGEIIISEPGIRRVQYHFALIETCRQRRWAMKV